MSRPLTAALGAGLGAFAIYQRRERQQAERLAAATLETLLNAVDANDPQTGAHVRRVAAYALILADSLGVDEATRRSIERIALFHDIGKIHEALFDIIHEKSRLTPTERREIATHPARGARVLAPLAPFYPELPNGVLSHHERWDGNGYPRGLRGTQIPLETRIVTIADTFDAVVHSRRYREGAGAAKAGRIIAGGRGTQFDPSLVDLLMLPPVYERFVNAKVNKTNRTRRPKFERRDASIDRAEAPDIRFRWRTNELRAAR
jgi:putative nucleotidyltransferase with HDIG domain